MALIEQKTRDAGRWSDMRSVDNAVAMFEAGKAAIALPPKSGKGYSRRGAGMAWTTVYKVLSETRRSKKGAKAGHGKRVRIEESESSASGDEEVQMEEGEEPLEDTGRVVEATAAQPPKKRRSGKT